MSYPMVELSELILKRNGSVNPAKFLDETFELHSIPAFDKGYPEILKGSEIGSSKQIVQENDVMISKIVPHIRRAAVVPKAHTFRQVASGEWIVFRSDRFDPNYLRHVLISDNFNAEFMATVSGVGGSLLRARPAFVEKIKVPLPTLHEQRRIAAILDKADELRQKRQQAIEKLDELLQAAFIDMFGDPCHYKDVGYDVDYIELKSVAKVTTGKTPPSSQMNMFNGQIPFVTPGDLGCEILTSKRTLTQEGAFFSKVVEKEATLVCCIGATIGKMGFATFACAFNQQINAISWGERILPKFGFVMMQFFRPLITELGTSTTLPILKKSEFEKIKVIVPNIANQKQFELIVSHIWQERKKQKYMLEQLELLFNSLQQKAFSIT